MELTKEDYMAVISEMAYKNIAGTDEADMRRGEREAQEEISGYLRSIYDVAKIFSATGENRNPQIVMTMVGPGAERCLSTIASILFKAS